MVVKFDNNKKKSDKDGAGVGPDQIYESLVDRKIKIIRHHPERDDDVGPIRPQAEKKLIHDAELVQLVGVELGHEFDTGHRAIPIHPSRIIFLGVSFLFGWHQIPFKVLKTDFCIPFFVFLCSISLCFPKKKEFAQSKKFTNLFSIPLKITEEKNIYVFDKVTALVTDSIA